MLMPALFQRIVSYVNAHASDLGFTLEYGTLRDYFRALPEAAKPGAAPSSAPPASGGRMHLNPTVVAHSWPVSERTDGIPYALLPNEPPVAEPPTGRLAAVVNADNTDATVAHRGTAFSEASAASAGAGAATGAATLPEQSWWSGEFTSWPLMKKLTRAGAAELRAAEQLNTLGLLHGQPSAQTADNIKRIGALRRASAEAQHHDAVDGTSPARGASLAARRHRVGQCDG